MQKDLKKKRKPTPIDPGPFRSRSLAPIARAVAAVLIGALVLAFWFAPQEPHNPDVPGPVAEKDIPPPPPPPPRPKVQRAEPVEPDTPNDPLGKAGDLKAVYVRYRESRDPIERAIAGRAHRACFPMFLPPPGEAPSPAYVIAALPASQKEVRRAAIEELFKRCRSFLVQPVDVAAEVGAAERATNGDLATPGALARWALIRGDKRGAQERLQSALTSREPYAIQSLSGLSSAMMDERSGAADPQITDAALGLLACDLGAACGRDSLLALQMCATEGRCEGSARDRMLSRYLVERPVVGQEMARLRALFNASAATPGTVWRSGP